MSFNEVHLAAMAEQIRDCFVVSSNCALSYFWGFQRVSDPSVE